MTDAHSRVNGGGRHECGRGWARGQRTGAVRGAIRVLTTAAEAAHAHLRQHLPEKRQPPMA